MCARWLIFAVSLAGLSGSRPEDVSAQCAVCEQIWYGSGDVRHWCDPYSPAFIKVACFHQSENTGTCELHQVVCEPGEDMQALADRLEDAGADRLVSALLRAKAYGVELNDSARTLTAVNCRGEGLFEVQLQPAQVAIVRRELDGLRMMVAGRGERPS